MITRQKLALLIVGDKEVTGVLEGTAKQPKDADKYASQGKRTFDADGSLSFGKAKSLRAMLKWLQKNGRICEMFATQEEEAAAAEADEAQLAEEEKKATEEEKRELKAKAALDFMTSNFAYDSSKSWADMDDDEF
ncbi:hypothetical protein DL546_005500 [Coniochaeta pulveracea]|uniref:Uncharacterized protein n=1 Tax=Coniochaeta pulveracea TaxID=177199 RepID=A0A420Y3Z7_9PEZI|nr:hypothetical protein DL546_005500 [Coniochaeta pulveracea]